MKGVAERLDAARALLDSASPTKDDLAAALDGLPPEWASFARTIATVSGRIGEFPPLSGVLRETLGSLAEAARLDRSDLVIRRESATEKLAIFLPETDASAHGPAPGPTAAAAAGPAAPNETASAHGAAEPPAQDSSSPDLDPYDPELLEAFLAEAHELLDGIEASILSLADAGPESARAAVDELFRVMHTLKGSCGMFNLALPQRLAHAAEDAIGAVREGSVTFSRDHESTLLATVDLLKEMVGRVERREGFDGIAVDAPIAALHALASGRALSAPGAPAPGPPAPTAPAPGASTAVAAPAALQSGGAASESRGARAGIRIDVAKLDDLFARMSEIVIGRIRLEGLLVNLRTAISAKTDPKTWRNGVEAAFEILESGHEEFARSSAALQEGVMSLRLVPMQTVFRRFPRVIRETAQRLGKQIHFQTEGAQVELDKEIAEALVDPLIHLVRNAIDHGIEPAAERAAAGKDPAGTLVLSAAYQGDKILVEVRDDGRGIDPDRVVQKALSSGLCRPEEVAAMSDHQKRLLILRPGFSTAEAVTDLSGRGVGMDVVRTMVEEFKGSLDLESVTGSGTTVRLYVPLTLAIVHLLMIQVGPERAALPLYCVRETLRVPATSVEYAGGKPVVAVRGEYLPVVHLARILGVDEPLSAAGPGGEAAAPAIPMVVLEVGGETIAVRVSGFLQKFDAVLKPLGPLLAKAPFVSGSTILGDGRIIPILDPVQVQRAARHETHSEPPRATTSAAPDRAAANGTSRSRILVAEDSQPILRQLAGMLGREGYDVTTAADGETALALARESLAAGRPFDLVSTDIEMPRRNGYELARALRDEPRFHHLPIVALTSRAESVDRIKGFEVGFDEYLSKPVDEVLYLRTIARMLARR